MIVEYKLKGWKKPMRIFISSDFSQSDYLDVWRYIMNDIIKLAGDEMRQIDYIKQIGGEK